MMRREQRRRACASSADDEPLGTEDLATHRLPLDDAPHGYDIFQRKADGCMILEP